MASKNRAREWLLTSMKVYATLFCWLCAGMVAWGSVQIPMNILGCAIAMFISLGVFMFPAWLWAIGKI